MHEVEAHREGCQRVLEAGRQVLSCAGSALDAVEAAICELESDPTINAGLGSTLNEDGEVEMCSALKEGAEFNVGGVAVNMGVKHAISVARALLHEDAILLAAEDAPKFAVEKGCETCGPKDLIPGNRTGKPAGSHDAVGCIALDNFGRMAVGTSTGVGRVQGWARRRLSAAGLSARAAGWSFRVMANISRGRCWQPGSCSRLPPPARMGRCLRRCQISKRLGAKRAGSC